MNKLRFVPIVALLLGLLSVTALAVETPTELSPTVSGGKTYTVTYDATAANSGKQYVILILKKGATPAALDVNSILYIDQAAAGADGKVKFENFQMMRNTSAEVYIGGETLASPAHPHTITVPGVSVSGKVGGTVGATVKLGTGGKDSFVEGYSAMSDQAGNFTLEGVPEGAYALQISKKYFITYYKASVTVQDALTLGIDYYLYGGDVNSDKAVNGADLSLLISDFGASSVKPPVQAGSDVNSDNAVNGADLSVLISSFGKSADNVTQ